MAVLAPHTMGCSCGTVFFEGFCQSCFKEAMQRRIRESLKSAGQVTKGEQLVIEDEFCRVVLKEVLSGLPITLAVEGREILPWTADDEIAAFLDALFHGEPLPQLGYSQKIIKLFLKLTDAETQKLAECYGAAWQPRPKQPAYARVEELAKKYPELKNSLLKSLEELKAILTQ